MEKNQKRQVDSEPAQSAPLTAQAARPSAKPRGRLALTTALAVFGSSAALILTGCPANLENPERFDDAGTPVTTDPNAAPACLTTAFGKLCTTVGCHDTTSTTLNLQTADVASRLVNVNAKHALVDTSMCPTAKYIDTANPANSWLVIKLNGAQGSCGVKMPEIGTWTSDDNTCLTTWIQTLSSGSGSGGSGSSGGSASTGGSGGAAATSGGSTGTAGGGGAPAAGGTGTTSGGASSAGAGGTAAGTGGA